MTKRQEEIRNAISVLATVHGADDLKETVLMIRQEHRTNQQSIGRLIAYILLGWDDDWRKNQFDARDEATIEWVHQIVQHVPFPAFPYI